MESARVLYCPKYIKLIKAASEKYWISQTKISQTCNGAVHHYIYSPFIYTVHLVLEESAMYTNMKLILVKIYLISIRYIGLTINLENIQTV